jgi:hypothetical protein
LRLGIAEAHVELDDLGSVGGHHQADVEKSGEAGRAHGRFDDGVEDLLAVGGGRCGRHSSAHASVLVGIAVVND